MLKLPLLAAAVALFATLAQADTMPMVPAPLLGDIHQAVVSEGSADRQKALDELLVWTKQSLALPIDWKTLASLEYHIESDGSKTDAGDPAAIRVSIGWNAFNCDGNAYSTFRHELVHVAQHQDQARALKRGWGIQEIEAYLWELDHAAETGLDRCDRKDDGKWDTKTGVARAMDGLFRYLVVLGTELSAGQAQVADSELTTVNTHVSCVIRRYPAIVLGIYPELDWSRLPECVL